jgi:hypothetical protein
MLVKGYGGSVEFDGQVVTIRHTGLSRLRRRGDDERIPLGAITAVHLRSAGALTNGLIQFMGPDDDSSMIFTRKQQREFDRLRMTIEQAIQTLRAAPRPRPRQSQQEQAFGGGIAGQLAALSQMHESGELSNEEFDTAQARLLG